MHGSGLTEGGGGGDASDPAALATTLKSVRPTQTSHSHAVRADCPANQAVPSSGSIAAPDHELNRFRSRIGGECDLTTQFQLASPCLSATGARNAAPFGYRAEEEWQQAFDIGEWDRTLHIIDEMAGSSLFAAKRAMHAAMMGAFREGPAPGLALADRPRQQLLGDGAPQWTRHAAVCGVLRFLAGDLAGAVEEARLGLGLPPEVYVEDALTAGILAAEQQQDLSALAELTERARSQLTRVRSGLAGDPKEAAFPDVFAAFARGIGSMSRCRSGAGLGQRGTSVSSLGSRVRSSPSPEVRRGP